ncbi:FAD-dependent oxidoreductase [Prosthecobacter sp.]|uniref:FAD-dependent oxidoreductase n=1 Tax=Prosthecobacter sp. TaxID=1965333 RepID=UPI0024874F80|nr:FAD-dependent oxidoreductase [Prosthecobacter sp.]MDI1314011.1 FAD-dependent oxidoreductase [Prosthecobacter sp.]
MKLLPNLLLATLAAAAPLAAADSYDIVVYGGSSGGITAAIQAARMGRTAVIIEPTKFLGGLTTGGLGATDIGNKKAIGGMSREFYANVFTYYNDPAKWQHQTREEYYAKKPHGNSGNENTMWTFEPHVATAIYETMLGTVKNKVTVVFSERLDLKQGVIKSGTRITQIIMESGRTFAGKMFIDATYEGDLMAKAGVSYAVGREPNTLYDETINGVQKVKTIHHQFTKNVDPYVVPGDPKSGVLPGIDPGDIGEDGSGDNKLQAYNFRMCTTDVPENRLDWEKPANYDEKWFELALRNVEAGDDRISWAPSMMPNRKTDTNNNFAISTDFIGQNFGYPDGDYATRAKIWQAHVDWQKGLMWTYAYHPRVPEKIRTAFQKFGLSKDEFKDNGNWPRQLYVREVRRMVGGYVMSEKNCKRREIVEDSVGMGAYNMDSHNVQRYITKEGFVRNEGDIQIGTRPYPISYRSITPKAAECTNLLVPICLSATHISYGSIRMEPVFMVMGQSAATAAVLAIESDKDLQQIDLAKLKEKLLADGQVLDFESPPMPEHVSISKEKLGGIVVDDSEAELTGFSSEGHGTPGFVGAGYRHDGDTAKGEQKARFTPDLPAAGQYRVAITYSALGNRADKVPVIIHHAEGEATVIVNEKKKAPEQDILLPLGTYRFEKGKSGWLEIRNEGTKGHVLIDAAQWLPAK